MNQRWTKMHRHLTCSTGRCIRLSTYLFTWGVLRACLQQEKKRLPTGAWSRRPVLVECFPRTLACHLSHLTIISWKKITRQDDVRCFKQSCNGLAADPVRFHAEPFARYGKFYRMEMLCLVLLRSICMVKDARLESILGTIESAALLTRTWQNFVRTMSR